MKDESKTQKQLICELMEYRQRVAKLEASEGLDKKANENSDLLSYNRSQAKPDQYLSRGNQDLLRENQEILEYLTRSRLFSHLPKRILEQLLPLSHLEDYPSGSEILIEGAINTKVFFLIRGVVSVYAGGNKISKLRRKGDIFGEMSIISNKPCSASIIAETPVRLFSIMAKHIGEYTDIETNELDNILYRTFAMILTDKLSLTNKKAQQYETIHKDLLREIDERKLVEEKLEKAKNILEKRVDERTSELKSTNERLQREIEERKQAEKTLQKSEKKYRGLFDSIRDAILVTDTNRAIVDCNPEFSKLFGFSKEEIKGEKTSLLYESAEQFEKIGKTLKSQHATSSFIETVNYKKKDGEVFPGETGMYHLNDNHDEVIGFIGLIRDITDRKRTENELNKSKVFLGSLLEAIPIPVFYKDRDGKYLGFNHAFEEFFGKAKEELIGKSVFDINPPELAKIYAAKDNALFKNGRGTQRYETQVKDATGVLHDVVFNKAIFTDSQDNIKGLIGAILDITDLKQIEAALLKNEKLHQEAQRVAKIGHWELDSPSGTPVWSEQIFHILGLDPAHSVPSFEEHKNIIHDADWDLLENSIQKLNANDTPFDIELRILKPDGEIRWMHSKGSADKSQEGHVIRMFGTAQDITERKNTMDLLARNEKHLKTLIHNIADGIMVIDQDGNVLLTNPAAETLFGRSEKELLNNPVGFPLADNDENIQTEVEIRRKNNVIRFAEMKISQTNWEEKDAVLLSLRDITDRKESEIEKEQMKERLLQSQKMESIGTLAGGIAHDFNNILSAIIGFTEMSLDELNKESDIYDNLQEVFRAGLRAKDLVSQILTFSRQSETDLKPLRVSLIVAEALKLLRASIPTTIEFHQDISSKAAVKADPTQIHQIIMNLCTNAYHAMRETGGILSVSLKDIKIETALHKRHVIVEPGRWIHLSVSDTGHGMPPEIASRVFDPYFTTKEKGDGTGLGLAVVQAVVEKCEGQILVDSEINKGTTFDIYLPVYASDALPVDSTEIPIPTGSGHILVVDDELPIVKMIKQIVERLGYTAETRTDPIEALALLKTRHERFDLVISDMTMPKMSGLQLADQLHQFCPNMPFILCTGYSDQVKKADFSRLGISALAMKPVVKSELAILIKKAMDESKTQNQARREK